MPVLNVYLHDSEGPGPQNHQLLMKMAAFIKAVGRPFIAGGDWNMGPDALRSTGWLDLVNASIVATNDS
eukprot:7455265-Karenia_brevis.AAC.1